MKCGSWSQLAMVSLGAILASVACTHKHLSSRRATQVFAKQAKADVLNATFKPVDARYDSKDQMVSDFVAGVELTSTLAQNNIENVLPGPTAQLLFQVFFKDLKPVVLLKTDMIPVADLKSGKVLDLKVEDMSADAILAAGGTVSARAMCLDAECGRVGLLLQVAKGAPGSSLRGVPGMAGIIFVNKGQGFVIEVANGGLISRDLERL